MRTSSSRRGHSGYDHGNGDGDGDGYAYPENGHHRRRPQQLGDMPPTIDGPLALPVVIPQQRPGSKERGFMAAYAPCLETCDGNKMLSGVQTVSFGASFTPEMIAMGVATATQAAAYMANKAHVKHKMNSILDRYNQELFSPRGLFCMVMEYEPELPNPSQAQSQGLFHHLSSLALSVGVGSSWLRDPVSGKVQGAHRLPTYVAPLVYIDDRRQHKELLPVFPQPSSQPDGKKSSAKETAKRALDAANDYLDRRARARYAAENTGDVLNAPLSRPFKSRYLDPNHPATNGGLIGLLSGGVLTPDREMRRHREHERIKEEEIQVLEQYYQQMESIRTQNQSRFEIERQLRQCEDDYGPRLEAFRARRSEAEGVERHIKMGILYLAIVNRPSDTELAAVRATLDRDYGHGMATADV